MSLDQHPAVLNYTLVLTGIARKKARTPPAHTDHLEILDAREFGIGTQIICPFCNYTSRKNKKGSARIFRTIFKCFHCNEKRRCENHE